MTDERLFHNCKNCAEVIFKSAKVCPKCGTNQKRKLAFLEYALVIFLAWIIISMVSSLPNNISTQKIDNKDEVRKNLILDFSWSVDGFGMTTNANFNLHNKSNQAIKDIEIKCDYYANSGTKIDSNTKVIYEAIDANSKKGFRNINMGFIQDQVESSTCAIVNFNIINLI